MDFMEEKSIICKAIEDKKQEKIKEYDERISDVMKETNIAKIYYLLAETFHNGCGQGEIGIEFLKKTLTNPFFKEANARDGVNYIIFYNEEFEIMFSRSLSKEIRIKYKKAIRPSYYCSQINPTMIKLGELIEAYLNKKSFKNFKALADYNGAGYNKNVIGTIMKYINTHRKCNKDALDQIRERQENYRLSKIKQEEEKKIIDEQQEYAKKFIDSLTDLQIFKDEDWFFRIYGIRDEKGNINWE